MYACMVERRNGNTCARLSEKRPRGHRQPHTPEGLHIVGLNHNDVHCDSDHFIILSTCNALQCAPGCVMKRRSVINYYV